MLLLFIHSLIYTQKTLTIQFIISYIAETVKKIPELEIVTRSNSIL